MRVRWSTTLIAGSMVTALTLGGAALATQTASSTSAPEVSRSAPTPPAPAASTAASAFGDMPLAFVPNRGQTDPRVRYYAVGRRSAFFATPDELMLSLSKGKPSRHLALALRFLHRSPHAKVTAAGRTPGTVNYLAGRRTAAGTTGLSQYRQIVYRNLWPRSTCAWASRTAS